MDKSPGTPFFSEKIVQTAVQIGIYFFAHS